MFQSINSTHQFVIVRTNHTFCEDGEASDHGMPLEPTYVVARVYNSINPAIDETDRLNSQSKEEGPDWGYGPTPCNFASHELYKVPTGTYKENQKLREPPAQDLIVK